MTGKPRKHNARRPWRLIRNIRPDRPALILIVDADGGTVAIAANIEVAQDIVNAVNLMHAQPIPSKKKRADEEAA
jgi:hypothetical protein